MKMIGPKIETLIAEEKAAIAAAVSFGQVDPTSDADQLGTLFPTVPGQKYRRFIRHFGEVMFDNLNAGNVRKEDFDQKHCDTVVKPWLSKDGRILCSIFTTLLPGSTKEECESGHHRAHSSNELWPTRGIPRNLLDSDIYECDIFGNVTNPVPVGTSIRNYIAIVSKMQSNPTSRHKQYNMDDRAQQIHSLIKEDPTLRGLVPVGVTLEGCPAHRELWTKIMDAYVPDQFPGTANHTKLFNKFLKATDDKIKEVTDDHITAILVKRGLDTGISTKGRSKKRKAFLKHYDEPTNCLIASFDTNGRNIQHKLEALFRESYWRGDTDHYPAGLSIGVVLKIDNPSTSLVELDKERDEAITSLHEVNQRFIQEGIMTGGGPVLIRWVEFPPQLKNNTNDVGRFAKLHKPVDVSLGETGTIPMVTQEDKIQDSLPLGLRASTVH
jgi:hypothetical protein